MCETHCCQIDKLKASTRRYRLYLQTMLARCTRCWQVNAWQPVDKRAGSIKALDKSRSDCWSYWSRCWLQLEL